MSAWCPVLSAVSLWEKTAARLALAKAAPLKTWSSEGARNKKEKKTTGEQETSNFSAKNNHFCFRSSSSSPDHHRSRKRDRSPKGHREHYERTGPDEEEDVSSYANLDNLSKNPMLNMVSRMLNTSQGQLGIGIPQRSYSYIFGRPKE